LEQDDVFAFVRELVELNVELGFKEAGKPVFEVFVAFFCKRGAEGCADDFVCFVADSPDEICVGFALEFGTVGRVGVGVNGGRYAVVRMA